MLSDEEILGLYPHIMQLIEDRLSQRLVSGVTAQNLNLGNTDGAGNGELWATAGLRTRGGLALGDTGYAPPASGIMAAALSVAPNPPASSHRLLYPKANHWYDQDSSGNEAALMNATGWVRDSETWTYSTSSAFTRSGATSTLFPVGTKLRFKQGGSFKYAYVISVSGNTVSICGGSDYSLSSETITDNAFSFCGVAQGFPSLFNWSPTFNGFSVNPTGLHKFWVVGGVLNFHIRHFIATSNAAVFTLTMPVSSANGYYLEVPLIVQDNGVTQTQMGLLSLGPSSSLATIYKSLTGGDWTTSGVKLIYHAIGFYKIG